MAVQTAHAADWSPIIDGWYGKGFCFEGSTQAEKAIIASASVDRTVSGLKKVQQKGVIHRCLCHIDLICCLHTRSCYQKTGNQ